jgi:arylamine N-acetyltransferase
MASAYSTAQLSKYLEYITLPIQYAQCVHDPLSFPKTEEALTSLFRCQITAFPYDNLSVHYSATPIVDIHPESIYTKLMGSNDEIPSRRGGYCFECNIFFYHVLRGLGFTAYMTGVRNRERIDGIPQGEFKGWYGRITQNQMNHTDKSAGRT